MKEIKQKPAGGKPKTADAARVPKAVVKAAWLQAREAARAGEKQVVGGKDGAYSGAADTGEKGADKLVSTGERVTELAYRGGRKLAERSAGQRRERAKAAQTGGEAAQRHGAGETIAHTSTIEASRPPQTREAGRVSDENRPAGARPQQRESRAVGRAKPIKPGREMKQGAPGPKTTEQAGKARQAVQAAARNGQAKARFTQRAQQTAKRAVDTTKRATDAARAGMRALVEALHSLLIALAAGGSVAVLIVVLICLIAFVAGSAYGIFFAAEAPGEDAFTVQQAVEQLGGEYRDYLQQIESTMPHDRQEIKANDDVYYIRWQDVLAVFSSYVSGAEDGAPVAYLDESRLQQLRQTMWDMNEVAYSTYTETVEIEADEPAGDENTDSGDSSKNPGEDTESGNGTESAAAKTVTQTVLLIELTHKTPDEMAQDYAYTARQQEYLDLLRAPEYETLWAELLGGFLSGGGEILAPAGAWQSTGPLQWPLPITGSINLRILTGEKIAIVGENGSGKTTLLYLLLGIYRPISGEASVNGKTMELNLDNYRKKTACLIQNFVHFQMTLRENLAPNDFSELSEDPLIDFANNFPDRLNTFLGALDSNGVELSGGQWKRIALYRTLHKKDVDLIVLDEPTANLDPKISENIINRLLKPNYNKTVIVITHDFELAKKFDRIIGMKEGKIICDSPPQAFAWELFEKHNSDKRSLPQIG